MTLFDILSSRGKDALSLLLHIRDTDFVLV
jgi:hypothetical protein